MYLENCSSDFNGSGTTFRNNNAKAQGGGGKPTPPPVVTELPDPNVPGAPEEVTVIEEDVPRTYVKTWDPEEEEYVYVPEEEVPLADVTPETGDHSSAALWTALLTASAAGLCVLHLTKLRKKEELR